MNLKESLDKIKEDRPIVEPFCELLLKRIREKHPDEDIRMEDIEFQVTLKLYNGPAKIHRLLADMIKEGVSF